MGAKLYFLQKPLIFNFENICDTRIVFYEIDHISSSVNIWIIENVKENDIFQKLLLRNTI